MKIYLNEVVVIDKKSKIRASSFLGFVFSLIAGTFLHFAFKKSGGNTIVAVVAPVNESVWEHLKLLFFPSVIYFVFEFAIFRINARNFCSARLFSLFIGLIFTVVTFYLYTGVLGENYFLADVGIFILSVVITYSLSSKLITEEKIFLSDNNTISCLLLATALTILFIYFTFHPPMFELFKDPISEDFGIILP